MVLGEANSYSLLIAMTLEHTLRRSQRFLRKRLSSPTAAVHHLPLYNPFPSFLLFDGTLSEYLSSSP